MNYFLAILFCFLSVLIANFHKVGFLPYMLMVICVLLANYFLEAEGE